MTARLGLGHAVKVLNRVASAQPPGIGTTMRSPYSSLTAHGDMPWGAAHSNHAHLPAVSFRRKRGHMKA